MIIKKLSFKFDKETEEYFFKDQQITFTPNTVHFIQGDNGVGKSTFFNIMRGAIDHNAYLDASILLNDTLYSTTHNSLPYTFVQQVHTVQQQYDGMIAQQFTFMENLQCANMPRYPHLASLPQAVLFDVIHQLGIDVHKPAYLLSGGQRQLLAIVMALQKSTKLLLLDEPTATLDKKNARLIIGSLYRLSEQLQVTMLVICHDRELIKEYARSASFEIKRNEQGKRIFVTVL